MDSAPRRMTLRLVPVQLPTGFSWHRNGTSLLITETSPAKPSEVVRTFNPALASTQDPQLLGCRFPNQQRSLPGPCCSFPSGPAHCGFCDGNGLPKSPLGNATTE